MDIQKHTFPGKIVKKSNALARAKWPIENIYEPRLVALVASRVRNDDKDFHTYEISVAELVGSTRIDGQTYNRIKKAAKKLMSRVIEIKDDNGSWAYYNVFSKAKYDSRRAVILIRFDPDMKEHYIGLKKYFTQYSLIDFLKLPSVYSQRLFEILKSWSDKSNCIVELSELQKMLYVPDSYKDNFAALRRFVLEKAYKDIHKHTSLAFEWEPIKEGRKVTAIRFTFPQKVLGLPQTNRKSSPKQVQKQLEKNNATVFSAKKCFEWDLVNRPHRKSAKSAKCIFRKKTDFSKNRVWIEGAFRQFHGQYGTLKNRAR